MNVKIGVPPNAYCGVRCDLCGFVGRIEYFWWEQIGNDPFPPHKHRCMDRTECAKRKAEREANNV